MTKGSHTQHIKQSKCFLTFSAMAKGIWLCIVMVLTYASLQSIVLTYLPTATTVSVYLPSYSRHFTNPNSFTTMTEKTRPYLGKGGGVYKQLPQKDVQNLLL